MLFILKLFSNLHFGEMKFGLSNSNILPDHGLKFLVEINFSLQNNACYFQMHFV